MIVVIGAATASLSDRADDSTRIAGSDYSFGDIPRHDAAGSYHGSRADADASENDRASAHPNVRPDVDRLPEFLPAPLLSVKRMQGRVNRHCRPEEREVAYPDAAKRPARCS